MNKLDLNSLTKKQIAMAAKCKTPEELIELAKKAGIELTTEQAQAYIEELENVELDEAVLDKVAGGNCYSDLTGPWDT
jgi:ribosomal protein L12E/L44/L45/RPP1/RPP2